jgi:hypothetical protein
MIQTMITYDILYIYVLLLQYFFQNQKRLILKVWHLIDPNVSKDINLRRDIVIGFSAIDLSVLMAGFPTVSGWFHIMDFTGKCNGQIKVNLRHHFCLGISIRKTHVHIHVRAYTHAHTFGYYMITYN